MIFLLHGSESFLVDRALERLLLSERQQLVGELNDEVLPPTASLAALEEALRTPPFLAGFRLVQWKDPVLLSDARRARPETLEHLARILTDAPETAHLVLALHRALPPSHPVVHACRRLQTRGLATVEAFDPLRRTELGPWLQQEATALDVTLSRDGARELVARSQLDLGILHQELVKLALYVGPKGVIDPEAVVRLVGSNRLHTIFALTDALATPGSPEAVRLIGQLYAEGAAAAYVQFMLAQHFLRLLRIRLLRDQQRGLEAVRAQLGRSYAVDKAYEQAARWRAEDLRRILRELYDLEWAVKSGQADAEAALEAFVFRLSTQRPLEAAATPG
jgi:DNA polymerase-3 subunit delta